MLCKKKNPLFVWKWDRKICPLLMPNSDPWDQFFYPILTFVLDSYIIEPI